MKHRSLKNGTKSGEVSEQNAKKKMALVDNIFTTYDLKEQMDKRKVFGEFHIDSVRRIIRKAIKLNLIKKHKKGSNKLGKSDIYKKI